MGGGRPFGQNVAAATLMCWFNFTGTASGQQDLIGFATGSAGSNTTRLRLEITTGPVVRVRARALDGDSSSLITSPNNFTGGWHHAAAVIFFTTAFGILYIDGVQDTAASVSATMTAGNTSNTASLSATMGGHLSGGTGEFFNGELADGRIYHRALGPAEILTIFNGHGRDGINSSLQARWGCKDGPPGSTVVSVADLGPSAYGGAPVASPIFAVDTLTMQRRSQARGRASV